MTHIEKLTFSMTIDDCWWLIDEIQRLFSLGLRSSRRELFWRKMFSGYSKKQQKIVESVGHILEKCLLRRSFKINFINFLVIPILRSTFQWLFKILFIISRVETWKGHTISENVSCLATCEATRIQSLFDSNEIRTHNHLMFLYELSGCGFESRSCHLYFMIWRLLRARSSRHWGKL